jgi:UDP-2-acetamido-3-amino-2,3-dideoxy-glucuronate N-acetyltransferase
MQPESVFNLRGIMKSSIHPSLMLVGAGNWGKNLARHFHALGFLHTICDTREAILDTYATQYPEVTLTTHLKAALENPLITKVVIATTAASHFSIAKQALLAGKDVFVEKPLCLDAVEGEELIKIAKERALILMVGHLLQYHPCVLRLQELLAQGELGKLQYVVSNRLNLGSIRTEENALWSFAPHDFSVIISLCGYRLPQKIRSVGSDYLSKGIADTTMTIMRFEGNIQAHVYVSWLNPFKEQKLTVIGSTGIAVFDDTQPWADKLVLFRNHVKWEHGNIPQANKNAPEKIAVEPKEPLGEECQHFLKCCQQRTQPRTDGYEGLRVLKALQAAQASLNEDGEAKDPSHFHFLPRTAVQYDAHPTAIIDAGAIIASGVKIWHFSHIMAEARIGPSCNIGQNVVVSPGVILGSNVKVQNNVSLYSGVICEDDVFLGPSMVFTNVINPRSAISRKNEYQKTLVKKGATIGANATILCGIELGEYSFVGAGAVVTKSIKPYALVVGNPAKQIGWMSRHGTRLDLPVSLPLHQEKTAACPANGEVYKLIGDQLMLVDALIPSSEHSLQASER